MGRKIRVVIGGAYGDEGKGLATDLFSTKSHNTLVIKHNGGAQAGHTVETENGKRFVFHGLSSGSFRGADTLWADTFLPDLYKLSEELDEFQCVAGFRPPIFACGNASVTLIDDVLLNMALEISRGSQRHGSCGMGINEADLRTRAGFGITLEEIKNGDVHRLTERMLTIRKQYLPKRLAELKLDISKLGEYGELLASDNTIRNAAVQIYQNSAEVTLVEDKRAFLSKYENIIFESGQGLLLDTDCVKNYPHVTASKTGLNNPLDFLRECGTEPDEVLYVMRSYLTRHGAGPLPFEKEAEEIGKIEQDMTNVPNPWQGSFRYSLHSSLEDFLAPICEDVSAHPGKYKVSLLISHLNETDGKLKFADGDMTVESFSQQRKVGELFSKIYLSDTKYARDITCKLPVFSV